MLCRPITSRFWISDMARGNHQCSVRSPHQEWRIDRRYYEVNSKYLHDESKAIYIIQTTKVSDHSILEYPSNHVMLQTSPAPGKHVATSEAQEIPRVSPYLPIPAHPRLQFGNDDLQPLQELLYRHTFRQLMLGFLR